MKGHGLSHGWWLDSNLSWVRGRGLQPALASRSRQQRQHRMSKRKPLERWYLTRSTLQITTVAILLFLPCGIATGQGGASAKRTAPFGRVPSLFERQRDALGRRALSTGRELTVYTGEFVDAITGKRSTARVFHQPPGLVRLEGFNSPDSLVLFDGTRATGVLSR